MASSRVLVHLPALRSHPGSILSGDERVFIFGGGGVFRFGGLVYVTRIRAPLRQRAGRRGRRPPLQSNFLGQIDGVRGLTLVTGTGGGLTQTPTRGEVGGGAGRG